MCHGVIFCHYSQGSGDDAGEMLHHLLDRPGVTSQLSSRGRSYLAITHVVRTEFFIFILMFSRCSVRLYKVSVCEIRRQLHQCSEWGETAQIQIKCESVITPVLWVVTAQCSMLNIYLQVWDSFVSQWSSLNPHFVQPGDWPGDNTVRAIKFPVGSVSVAWAAPTLSDLAQPLWTSQSHLHRHRDPFCTFVVTWNKTDSTEIQTFRWLEYNVWGYSQD